MKQLTAILLLFIMGINTIGYRFIISWQQQQAHTDMVAKLDKQQYKEEDLIEIATPLNLPYFTDWRSFERCDGQVTINGTVYNYVARKYVNNVMIYKCIPNYSQQQINNLKIVSDNMTFGSEDGAKNKAPHSTPTKDLPEYDAPLTVAEKQQYAAVTTTIYPRFAEQIATRALAIQLPPPDAA